MPLLDEFGERGALIVFPVSQDHARLARRDDVEPTHQIGLPRMRAESAECVNRRFHRDFFSENLHFFLTIDKPSAERAMALMTDDQHMRARLPKIGSQMMENPAPLHIPAPAMTRHAPRTSLIARDSSAVGVGFIVFRSARSGRSWIKAFISSSNNSECFT